MDIQLEKRNIINRLKSVTDESLIMTVKNLLDYALGKTEQEGDDRRITVEQYNRELDEADAAIDRGEYLTHEEAVKQIRSWREG